MIDDHHNSNNKQHVCLITNHYDKAEQNRLNLSDRRPILKDLLGKICYQHNFDNVMLLPVSCTFSATVKGNQNTPRLRLQCCFT